MNAGLVERPSATTRQPPPEPTAAGIIGAIVSKDVTAFRRDRFLVLITLLVLICWGVIFHLLPSTDETVTVGVAAPQITAGAPFPNPAGANRGDDKGLPLFIEICPL